MVWSPSSIRIDPSREATMDADTRNELDRLKLLVLTMVSAQIGMLGAISQYAAYVRENRQTVGAGEVLSILANHAKSRLEDLLDVKRELEE